MGSPYTNPASAFDGNATTFASGFANTAISPIAACKWRGWTAAIGPYTSLILSVDSEVLTPTPTVTTAWLGYSTDGGVTWTTIYLITGANLTRARTVDTIVLPPGTNLSNMLVRASIQVPSGAGTTSTHHIYEISASGVLATGIPVLLTLTNQSARVCVTPPIDPQETAIRLYRRGGTLPDNWFQVGQYPLSTLAQGVCGAGTLEIDDNIPDSQVQLGAILPQDNFRPVQSVQAVNFPLPVIFGPSDGRVLACGDPARPDAVYFSNRGNADLWGAEAWVVVANPGEQMMNGLVYNLRTFAFSRERLYIMLPNIIAGVTFTPAETACRRGLKGRWAFTSGEQGIYFWSKDGIYRTSGGPEQSIIDDSIRPLFPTRESPAGTPTNGYDAIDMDDEDSLRMAFHNGEIWCYYMGATTETQQLLIYDERRSRWRPGTYTPTMQLAYSEPNVDSSLLYGGADGSLYIAGGDDDAGTAIPVNVVTGAFDQGRPLNLKEYLNTVFDIDPGGATTQSPVIISPRLNGKQFSFADGFNGGNQNPIGPPWINVTGVAQVLNGALSPGNLNTIGLIVYGAASPTSADQSSSATLVQLKPGSGYPALVLRCDLTGQNFYYVNLDASPGFGGIGLLTPLHLQKFIGGVLQGPPYHPFGLVTPRIGDVFTASVVGNTISVYRNGALIGSFTDIVAPISTGRPGLLVQSASIIPGIVSVSDMALGNWQGQADQPLLVTGSGRQRIPLSLSDVYGYNLEFDISWKASATVKPVLYQYETLYRHEPAEVTHWELPRTSLGMEGWFHIRDMYVVLRSNADVTLTVTPDVGGAQTFTLPNTGGLKNTVYVKLAASKSNSYAFALDSSAPFRVYQQEVEVRAKGWLTKLGYKNVPIIGGEQVGRPFGVVNV